MSAAVERMGATLNKLAAARGLEPTPGPALHVEAKLIVGRYLANRRFGMASATGDVTDARAGMWQPSHFNKEISDVLDRIRGGIQTLAKQEAAVFGQLNINTETMAAIKHCDGVDADKHLAELAAADEAIAAPHRRNVAVILLFEAAFCGALAAFQKLDAPLSMPVRLTGEVWFAYYREAADAVGLKAMNAAKDYQTMRRVRDIVQQTG